MQTDTVVADIAARLVRLEKSNRRLRITLAAVVVAASSLALGAAGRQDSRGVAEEIRATNFVVVDSAGQVRGRFGVGVDGSVGVASRAEGGEGFSLMAKAEGSAALFLRSALADVSLDAKSPLAIKAAKKAAKMDGAARGIDPKTVDDWTPDAAAMTFFVGQALAAKFASSEVGGSLFLGRGVNEKVRIEAPVVGDPTVSLSDDKGVDRLVLGATSLRKTRDASLEMRSASSLVLFGPDGSVIDKLPR